MPATIEKQGQQMTCYIKENSWLAKLAAKKLRAKSVAIVIGKTIHLHNASRKEFLAKHSWVRHELKHIRQYQQHGLIGFLAKYLWESLKKGYSNNKFEIEAKAAENDPGITDGITLL